MSEKKISLEEAYKIAVDFHTKGKINDAKKIYEKIIESKPDHFIVLSNLGIIFSQLKKFDKAIEFFDKAVKTNPKIPIIIGMHINRVRMKLVPSEGVINHIPIAVWMRPKTG